MNLPKRYYLRVPTQTLLLTFFALFNLAGFAFYLWFKSVEIPQYFVFILSFAAAFVGLSLFKILWWNVMKKGWLEVSAHSITFMQFFKAKEIATEDILAIDIPGMDDSAPLSDCINISAIASHLEQPNLQIIIPMMLFQHEDQELLPLLLSSVTK